MLFWRTLGGLAVCAGALAAAYVLWPRVPRTPLEQAAVNQGRTIITYWDRHSGHEHAARVALFDEFNRSQDEVYVRAVPIGYNAAMEKILTSTAGGAPPDVCSIDGGMLAQLSSQGLFLPLDGLVESEPSLHAQKFLPHTWQMVSSGGHVWGIPTTADAYCLVWNKDAFRRAGLDPERPPRTIAELEAYAAKLTLRTPSGGIEQMGFLPWLPWDQSLMWGILFGGDWYNPETGWVECGSDPGIIQCFAWQRSFTVDPDSGDQRAYALEPERIAAFSKGIGDYFSANNPFYSGKVAMISEGEWQATFIPKYAPKLDWGVAPMPRPEGVPPVAYGPACVADVIPATTRHPEAAQRLLKWFYSPRPGGGPSPASDYCHAIHNIPTRREDALQDRFMGNPKFRVFVEELLNKPVKPHPPVEAAQFFSDQVERMREQCVFHKVTPEEAAREVERLVNRELARLRALEARRRQ